MSFADGSKRALITCALALLTMAGCSSSPSDQSGQGTTATPDRPTVTFPQTSETLVVDPAHPPQAGATVKSVYDDRTYGKTEVRGDDYIRHADPVSPTGWTPWHHRAAPHNWSEPMTYESSVSGQWTAWVQSVDPARRLITLRDPSGKSETFEVDPKVQRLDEVGVGDTVTLTWASTLHGELRPPTAAESAEPIKAYSFVNRASSDTAPAGVTGTALRVVTTVDAVDLAAMTVTLKVPDGNRIVAHAKSPENIRKLHVGDTIVITYSQGVALSLTKTP